MWAYLVAIIMGVLALISPTFILPLWCRWAGVSILTLLLIVVGFGTSISDMKNRGIRPEAGNPTWFGFVKYLMLYTLIHIWFCDLVLQPISLWRLGLSWFILFQVVGWLYSSFLRLNGGPPLLIDVALDMIGVVVGTSLIVQFLIK